MQYEFMIAARHLRSMRRRRRVSFTALVAVTGVALGVAALVIVLSVSNGFSGMVWERLLGINPHLTLRKQSGTRIDDLKPVLDLVRASGSVVGYAPFIQSEGYVLRRSPGGAVYNSGVMVRGIDGDDLLATSEIHMYMWGGKADLAQQESEGRGRVYGMLIGRYLADRIGALVGSEVHLGIFPQEMMLSQIPRQRRYKVTGIFNTGNPELDAGLVFISRTAARRDLRWGEQVSGLHVRLQDPFDAERLSKRLKVALMEGGSDLAAIPWMADHSSLYFSINLEKWASFLALGLIVVVAGFNIISIQTMNVNERRREIGILKTMGVSSKNIGKVFTLEGFSIGLTGVVLGNMVGYLLCWIQGTYQLLKIPGDVLIIRALPVDMQFFDFFLISLAAVLVSYLFTLFPARDAAALDPVQAIRL
tara:strand:- start:3788 stop:5044 length:1257 start_codon:yes stop_codon:yes gene_type:complete